MQQTLHPAPDRSTLDRGAATALRAAVRGDIRARILDGRLPPGTRLVERTLAADIGVSRVPVREALRDLVAEGYAVTRPTRGIAVRDYPAAEIEELFQIRAALEGVLVDRAVTGLPPAGIDLLHGVLNRCRQALRAGDLPAAVEANGQFHEVLAQVAGGPVMQGLLDGVRNRMRWLLRQHGDPAAIHAEHEALLAAIEAGDRAAAAAVHRTHVATSRAALAAHVTAPGR